MAGRGVRIESVEYKIHSLLFTESKYFANKLNTIFI